MTEHTPVEISTKLEQIVPNHKSYLELTRISRLIFRGPKVLKTDSSFALSGVPYSGTPLMVNPFGDVIVEPSLWLIYMRTMNTAPGSVSQYATALCSFWRHLQYVARKSWLQVDDALLQRWRDGMVAGTSPELLQIRKRTVNKKLYVVLEFYRWAQEQGYVSDIIGPTVQGKHPFPIRLIEVKSRHRISLTSPLLYKTRRSAPLPVPSQEEIDQLYVLLAGNDPVDQRNVLLAQWALVSGMRRSEVLDRDVNELPTLARCQKFKEAERLYWMPIVGKGGVERLVPVSPEVLIETHRFIATGSKVPSPRDVMLRKSKRTTREGKIFLSSTTGKPLNLQSVSHIFTRIFRIVTGQTDGRSLHYHRLRARFASKLVQELAVQAIEKGSSIHDQSTQLLILDRAANILGHQDTKSLRYYLNVFIDQHDDATAAAARKSRRAN